MTRKTCNVGPRGFATLTAIGMIVLVAVALTALTTLVSHDVKRSVRQAEDAQLRQLLIVGEIGARASLDRPEETATDVKLPSELSSAGYALRFERVPAADGSVSVHVSAREADGRSLNEWLRYIRSADRWELESAELF